MTAQHFTFRSKRDRDRESDLLKNYREIGIAAIAAASRAGRTVEPKAPKAPALRLVNAHD